MCVQAHERLEEVKLQAVQSDNVQLVQDILESLKSLQGKDEAVAELARILQEPHFKVRLRRVERKPGRMLELGFKHSAASFFKAQTPQKYRSRFPLVTPCCSCPVTSCNLGWEGGMYFLWPITGCCVVWGAACHLVLCV